MSKSKKQNEKLERQVVAEIRSALRSLGWIVWKNHGSAYTEAGLPDLMAVRRGEFIAIEVKRPGARSRTTQSQRRWIRRLGREGVLAIVATSADEVILAVEGQGELETGEQSDE